MSSAGKVPEWVGILAMLLTAVDFTHAGVINVSLGDNPGPALNGPAGGAGTVWNTWSPAGGTLLDSDGYPTSVQVVTDGEGPYGDWWCDMQLLTGGFAIREQDAKLVSIKGLDPSLTYDFHLACARGGKEANTRCTPVIPNLPDLSLQADNRSARNGSSWVQGENCIVFHDLAPDSAGTVAFSIEGAGSYGILNGLQIVQVDAAVTTYEQWAADPAQGLTPGFNDGPSDDADGDGIINLLEFVTNGNPFSSSPDKQPGLLRTESAWVFEYDRRDASRSPGSEQVVEYSNDLLNWTSVPVPAVSSGIVSISDHGPFDRVRVSLPATMGKTFARLRVRSLTAYQQSTADPAQ